VADKRDVALAVSVDASYAGSQKCLGAPPGLALLVLNERSRARIAARKSKVSSWYFDANLIGENWGVGGKPRAYWHTLPVNSIYGLREALALLADEGLESLWARHAAAAAQLHQGLEAMGLTLFVKDPAYRLPTVTTINVPDGVLWSDVTTFISSKYNLEEISGGLGPTAGKVWRIGLMGHNARPGNVELVLAALRDALTHVGFLGAAKHTELDVNRRIQTLFSRLHSPFAFVLRHALSPGAPVRVQPVAPVRVRVVCVRHSFDSHVCSSMPMWSVPNLR
jgi:alanine-glyoxylate transaminase/serine-glyoxylate transaminase/serine-pyruvate transaminase